MIPPTALYITARPETGFSVGSLRTGFVLLMVSCLLAAAAPAQHHGGAERSAAPVDSVDAEAYGVYDGRAGEPQSLETVVEAMGDVEVVFLGERHDDSLAHRLEYELLRRSVDRYGDGRTVALSMEMFERDVQPVVDEYLAGLIAEQHFMQASRAWQGYQRRYHPLVAFARRHDLPVIAANAPRRYVNRVARQGRASLRDLPAEARAWLPPLPYPEASAAYRQRWQERMGSSPHAAPGDSAQADAHSGGSTFLDAQVLWDATMAYSIAEFLTRQPGALVLHITGAFHMEAGLGTPEQLAHYRPSARRLTVLFRPADDVSTMQDVPETPPADFLILTERP